MGALADGLYNFIAMHSTSEVVAVWEADKVRLAALENAIQRIAGSTMDARVVLGNVPIKLSPQASLGVLLRTQALESERCGSCGGTGYSLDAHEECCSVCGGNGWVLVPKGPEASA